MGYTPPDEDIRPPTEALIERITPAREAMMARIRNSAYKNDHQAALRLMVVRLTQLEVDLHELLG